MKMHLLPDTRAVAHRDLSQATVDRRIDAVEFLRLMLSTRKLTRSDDSETGIRGLTDPATGDRFVTEEDRLLPSLAAWQA